MSQSKGYWAGMRQGMKLRLVAFAVYILVSIAVLSQAPILGIFLLILPVLWAVLMFWLSAEAAVDVGPISLRKSSVLGYTLRYLWRRSAIARVVLSVSGAVLVVGGLGYISTEKLREEAAKPTLAERAAAMAESAADATKDKSSSWITAAKGWFTTEAEADEIQ